MFRSLLQLALPLLACATAQAQIDAANNDGCASAFPATGGTYTFDSSGATASGVLAGGLPPFVDTSTPDTACEDFDGMPENLHRDVWVEFTPAATGNFTISACNTAGFDTKFAIYSGTCGAPTALACNDDGASCAGFTSTLFVTGLASGTSYLVQLGGFDASETGMGTLSLGATPTPPGPPANDDCANPTDIGAGDQLAVPFDTLGATTDGGGHPICEYLGSDTIAGDVWFRWTAVASTEARLDTCFSSDDTKCAVYLEALGCAAAPIACRDDNSGCGNGERVDFSASAGESYLIRIGNWSPAAAGPIAGTFDITQEPAPTPGTNYCTAGANSQSASGALISAEGTASVSANDLVLHAGPLEPNQPGIFFYGDFQLDQGNGLPFGEGLRCAGGNVIRFLPPGFSDGFGVLTRSVDNTHPLQGAGILPNVSQNFQAWYRDPACPDCNGDGDPTGFNLSDGLAVLFVP